VIGRKEPVLDVGKGGVPIRSGYVLKGAAGNAWKAKKQRGGNWDA